MKRNKKKFDFINLDGDILGESLILCALYAKNICANIDAKVIYKATTPYIQYVSTEEQCNDIINDIYMKGKIVELRNIFKTWYRGLDETRQEICRLYFNRIVRPYTSNDKEKPSDYVRTASHRKDKVIKPMIRSFMHFYNTQIGLDERELISTPIIYDMYVLTKDELSRLKKRKRKSATKKGGRKHDRLSNARRNRYCV